MNSIGDERRTPKWLFNLLDEVFHFSFDAAATADNALCPKYWTKEDNALALEWDQNLSYFCNPPYSDLKPWINKMRDRNVIAILPARTDSSWFYWLTTYASLTLALTRRVRFLKPGGERSTKPREGTVISVFGKLSKHQEIALFSRLTGNDYPCVKIVER